MQPPAAILRNTLAIGSQISKGLCRGCISIKNILFYMVSIIIEILIILIMILLSAFFSSAETALTTISPHRLRSMLDEGMKHAKTLEKILSDRDKMLSVVLICNNIVNIAVSSLCTVLVQRLFGNWAVSIGTGVLTVLILVFGEISPKTIATYRSEKLALRFAPVIWFLMRVFTPIAAVVNFLASGVLRLFGIHKGQRAESYTENEIRSIVEVSTQEGVLEDDEKKIINNVFDFTDKATHEVMVPRVNITAIRPDSTLDEVQAIYQTNMYTRIPVYNAEETGFIGMLHIKDFLFLDPKNRSAFSVEKIMRELPYTYENKRLAELFMEMKTLHISMMAVMDEYGMTVGIVTMEDLLEELVGEIRDEYDADEEDALVETSMGEYEVPGSMSIADVNERLGTSLHSEHYDSVGGLMMELLDRLPVDGDEVQMDGVTIRADKVEGTKIETVQILVQEDRSESEEHVYGTNER